MNNKILLVNKIEDSTLSRDDKDLWVVFIDKIDEEDAKNILDGLVDDEAIKIANRNFQQKIWAAQLNDSQKMSEILEEEEEILRKN